MRILKGEEICLTDVCVSLIFQWNHQELKCTLRQTVAKEIGGWSLLTQMKPFPFGAEIKVRVSFQHSAIRNVPFRTDKWWFLHTTYCRIVQLTLFQLLWLWINNKALANCSTKLHWDENYGKTRTVFKIWLCKAADTTNTVYFKRERKGWGRKEEEKGFQNISNEACLTIIAAGGEADFKCENI